MSDRTKTTEQEVRSSKKPYKKPEVESAKIYERLSLACGKATQPPCRTPLKSA